jgi:hypothetical protein
MVADDASQNEFSRPADRRPELGVATDDAVCQVMSCLACLFSLIAFSQNADNSKHILLGPYTTPEC